MESWTKERIDVAPWQAIPAQMAALDLTDADGMTQVWFVDLQKNLSGGAEAVNRVMRLLWWARPFTYLYNLPGVGALQEWLYRWVAANRHRMPGGTNACRLPLDEKQ